MVFNSRQRHFLDALKRVSKTPDGQIVLAYLRADVVETPVVGHDPYRTYYQLGQKEFALSLVQSANRDDLDRVDLIKLNEAEG